MSGRGENGGGWDGRERERFDLTSGSRAFPATHARMHSLTHAEGTTPQVHGCRGQVPVSERRETRVSRTDPSDSDDARREMRSHFDRRSEARQRT